ncbi:MAG: bifunctional demethylmenaquinone methyltransferase/2-methoxy-6-polyprenyl-1,4-benzoquinol methylase UbiE [Bacteroidota bacterium]|nr:bifunctional demethylmenaquinone methyltransferase/2-methoxy-6-polyprenyl-1,4-benzoquinol methylase UbiE [Bacteroidota bacterium]
MKEKAEKKKQYRPLQKMFMEVPPKYDLLNRILTWRLDESWRKEAVREILKDNPEKVMDLCTGTGDLLFRIADNAGTDLDLCGLDFSPPMLEIAEQKMKSRKLENIRLIQGDAADIPFEENYFDAIGIAYGFRNLTYKNPDQQKFLKEIHRVIKPGGKFVIVETSRPKNKFMDSLHRFYMNVMVKRIGGSLSGNKPAYRYLANSATDFYTADEVCDLLKGAGFSKITYKHFVGGVAAMHVAVK